LAKIDLHTHSNCSDGTSSVRDILFEAKKAQLELFSLTDHDSVEGIQKAIELSEKLDIPFIPGVEITTHEHEHTHILGYNIDPKNKNLLNLLKKNREDRILRVKKCIAQLVQVGINITEQQVFDRVKISASRAHIADVLKINKVVANRGEGFRNYLMPGKAGYVSPIGATLKKSIYTIKEAGGIAVMAHPGLIKEHWNFPVWKEMGLDGVEVYYPSHSATMKQDLLDLCKKYNLQVFAGSDYHGPKAGRVSKMGMNISDTHLEKLKNLLQ
jgi:3',5'-nucleoside bisphosphate phosphatase